MDNNYQNQYNGYQNSYQDSYQVNTGNSFPGWEDQNYDMMQGGFEAEEPVKKTLADFKSIMYEEVVVKSYLFMVAALLITAFAAFTVSPYAAIKMLTGYNFYLLMFGELGIVFASNWAISKNNAVLAGILCISDGCSFICYLHDLYRQLTGKGISADSRYVPDHGSLRTGYKERPDKNGQYPDNGSVGTDPCNRL
jgi:hypothetical protein